MIKLIGKSEKIYFKGPLPQKFGKPRFSEKVSNSIFFRVLFLKSIEKNAKLSILRLVKYLDKFLNENFSLKKSQ